MAKYVIDIDEDNLDNNDIYCIVANAISLEKVLADLPVTPTRKKGKWINKSHTIGCGIKFAVSECTCCGKKTFFDCDQLVYNYCPNCGSYMREVEE